MNSVFTWAVLLFYLLLNLLLFGLMGLDKLKAKKDWRRIPEKNLLILGVISGGLGGLIGQQVFHHKTRKPVFWLVFILGFFVHVFLWFWLVRWFGR